MYHIISRKEALLRFDKGLNVWVVCSIGTILIWDRREITKGFKFTDQGVL